MADSKKEYLETEDLAVAWRNLADQNQKRGPITQIRLIQELFSLEFTSDIASLPITIEHARNITDHIYTQSIPTADTLLLVSILGAFKKNYDQIRSNTTFHFISNPTSDSASLQCSTTFYNILEHSTMPHQ